MKTKLIFTLLFLIFCCQVKSQPGKYVGKYQAIAESDSMYGLPLASTARMEVTLVLRPDSTYTLTNRFHITGVCSFSDSLWFNTGRWLAKGEFILFTDVKRSLRELSADALRPLYPIEHLDQGYLGISKQEWEALKQIPEKEFDPLRDDVYLLKFDEKGVIATDYFGDCFEDLWKRRRIEKVK